MNPHNKLFKFTEVAQILQRSQGDIQKLINENKKLKSDIAILTKKYNEIVSMNELLHKDVNELMENASNSERELVNYIEETLRIPVMDRGDEFYDNLE